MPDPDDDISPWARDDWTSAGDSLSFDALSEPVDPARSSDGGRSPMDALPDHRTDPSSPRPPRAQVWIAAAVGAVLLIGGIVALVRNDPTDRTELQAAVTADTATEATGATSPASTDRSADAPTTTAATGGVPTFWNDDPVETTGPRLAMATSSLGEVAVWNSWAVDVPVPLDVMSAPTEVVALGTDGILYRIEFPSGQVRAMTMAGWDANAQTTAGDEAIVVFTGTSLTVIRDGEPLIGVPMRDGVIFVEAWPGTDRFIVTTPSPGIAGGEQQLILEPDGQLVPVGTDSFAGNLFWARSFLPDGRVTVNRPGGVYAVGVDQVATRLSTGDLLATGTAHYAVVECDESLRCATFVIDAATGERTDALLDAISDDSGYIDPSTRISPDGRSIVHADRSRGTGVRQLVDVATGTTLDIGRVNEVLYPDSWAADSSGLFSEDTGSILFHPRNRGGAVPIEGFESIGSVATRRPPSG